MTFYPDPNAPEPRLPPAGWLPDPSRSDLERYWNGTSWTGEVRLVPSAASAPGAGHQWVAPSPIYTVARKRRRGSPLVWITALAAAVVIVALGYQGMLPTWVPWPNSLVQGTPHGPDVAYPVYGSDDLVLYLARSMVAQKDTISVSFVPGSLEQTQETVQDAMLEATSQNPYVFVSGWVMQGASGLMTVKPDYVYDDQEASRRQQETSVAISQLVAASGAAGASSPAQQIQLLHDAIARTAVYDTAAAEAIALGVQDTPQVEASQEAYGILVNHTAVCTGYAETMLLAADAIGLDAVIVTGTASGGLTTGPHAWNRIRMGGTWQVVDVTWDDLDATDASGTEKVAQDYVLVPDGDPRLDTRVTDGDWVVDGHEGLYGVAPLP